jgi:uncharacterized protein (DUF1501 family)
MKTEPTLKSRREFIREGALGAAVTWTVPAFLAQTFSALGAAKAKDDTILVVLQMAGGNDGLNTIVPFTNDHYLKARPRLGLKGDAVLKINDTLGFNPALEGFKALYDAGELSIVQGVGYPNPNRSHFRSTEIWATASDSKRFEKYGWLGRYFDNACSGADPTYAINVGRQAPQAFNARSPLGVSFDSPQNYRYINPDRPEPGELDTGAETVSKLNQADLDAEMDFASGSSIGGIAGTTVIKGSPLQFLERTAMNAEVSSDKIRAITAKAKTRANYPGTQLAASLKLVGQLIAGGMPTRVYYISQGGYDTHTNQLSSQARLHKDLADAVKAFVDDLKAQGNFQRVALMTFSEFGRRVAENASAGTDHGSASVMFMVGPKVKAGLQGKYPSLAPADLRNGDPVFSTDFRTIYAGVLEGWLRTPSAPILGKQFAPVPLV